MNSALSQSEKLALVTNLGTMITAGIPILEAVDSILEDARGSQKRILEVLRQDLTEGKTIASTFEKFPRAFDKVSTNIVRAAEEAGTLGTAFKDLSQNIKREIEMSEKIRAAMIYPALVAIVFFAVMIIILTFVIPRVGNVFNRLRINLPLPTRILVATSGFILGYWPFIIIGFAALFIAIILLYRAKKLFITSIFFSLPLVSNLVREIDLTRFTRSMALLLASGIPITESLELSQNVVNKKEIAKTIAQSKDKVLSGRKLSDGLKTSKKIIPPLMIHLIEAGEKSGTLEKSMQELSEYFDLRVSNSLKNIATLIEPALLLVIGLLVGGVMLAIIAPIYQLIGQIRTR